MVNEKTNLLQLFEPDKEAQKEAVIRSAMKVVVASNVANAALLELQRNLEDYLQQHWTRWGL